MLICVLTGKFNARFLILYISVLTGQRFLINSLWQLSTRPEFLKLQTSYVYVLVSIFLGKESTAFIRFSKKTNGPQRSYLYYTVGHAVAYKLSSERATTERSEVWANKSLPSSIQLEQLWLNFTYTYAFLRSLKTENH